MVKLFNHLELVISLYYEKENKVIYFNFNIIYLYYTFIYIQITIMHAHFQHPFQVRFLFIFRSNFKLYRIDFFFSKSDKCFTFTIFAYGVSGTTSLSSKVKCWWNFRVNFTYLMCLRTTVWKNIFAIWIINVKFYFQIRKINIDWFQFMNYQIMW